MEQASWEPLAPGCQVLVTREHGFSTDTLLLAAFSQPRRGERCADLGTGCGDHPPAVAGPGRAWAHPGGGAAAPRRRNRPGALWSAAAITDTSRWWRATCGTTRPCSPARAWTGWPATRPTHCRGPGRPVPIPRRRAARQGDCFSLEDLAQAARYSLKHRGRLCLCLPVRRLAEALALFSRWDLEPKLLRLVQQRRDKAPYLFLLECRRGGRPGGLEAAPTLLLEEDGGGPHPGAIGALRQLSGQRRMENSGRTGPLGGKAMLEQGALYVVGTPIGNLGDLSPPGGGDPVSGGLYRRRGHPGHPAAAQSLWDQETPAVLLRAQQARSTAP